MSENTKPSETAGENSEAQETTQNILDLGSAMTRTPYGNIYCLTIIGQIEGHNTANSTTKTTKYEHVLPLLAKLEESDEVDGLLVLLNTVGGDIEAGLGIAELISSMSKPTVSLVLGGGHSIGVPLAVAAKKCFIAPTASMTLHPVRMNGTVLDTIKKGKSVRIYEVLKDKNGNIWYRVHADEKAGYMRDFTIDLDDEDLELKPETTVSKASVGTAKTNRAANVRKTPSSDGGIVRQISKGTKIYITGKYADAHNQIWYQISTETGNTTGFMRDYVLDNVKLDEDVETQTYSE